ncbi:MAG: response regulator transcription factor [Desulfobacterales bacterium]|jgi:DNA-binding response OmpR family regulator|nr:response regulator transcription factor [Desulfobacterales bacterium]
MSEPLKKRILVIEDDAHIAEGLDLNLTLQGYEVRVAGDGVAGLAQWERWKPDLIVLDIMLPKIDGLSVLKKIRAENERLPILILSAKSAADDKIKGLAYGVDDYLAKPFNLDEFLLRVDRLLTKATWYEKTQENGSPVAGDVSDPYEFGTNRIVFSSFKAQGSIGDISLTEQETKLLKLFVANQGKPLSREKLLEVGWGYSRHISTRTVDNFIVRFRKYFEENPKKPVYFKSLRSVGYVFDPTGDHADTASGNQHSDD